MFYKSFTHLAGLPAQSVFALTLFVTTLPAAITAPFAIITPGNIILPAAIQTSSSIITLLGISSPIIPLLKL